MMDEQGQASIATRVGAIGFKNPILLASGTVGYGEEIGELVDLGELGGIVVKGLSLDPVRGNPTQRIAETPGGMLNSIGLQNVGVEAFVRDKLPRLREHDTRVLANIWGTTIAGYVGVAERLDQVEGVHGLELNVSCPNIKEGGISFGTDPQQLHAVTAAVRAATTKPLWVKMAPGVTDITVLARAAEEGGADALSLINTLRGMMVDVPSRRPLLATTYGGFSGPALFPIALYLLYEVSRCTELPIVGIGGINGLDQVLQFLVVGACAVQVGTANFYDPTISTRLVEELAAWCRAEQVASIDDLVGSLRP